MMWRNKRAPKMWEIISEHENFLGATVLDLGCGYGDLLLGACHAGASRVIGVDENADTINIARAKIIKYSPPGVRFDFYLRDINNRSHIAPLPRPDIALCTSVLPYIENREMLLSYLSTRATTTFVEMQYFGDGPGPSDIKNDDDMEVWLKNHWYIVDKIGETYTGRTPAYRSIWSCHSGRKEWLASAAHPKNLLN